MNSKERLLNTFHRKPVDRVPISVYELCGYDRNLWANCEPSYERLMNAIREHTDCLLMLNPDFEYGKVNELTGIKSWREGSSVFEEHIIHTPKGDLHALYRNDDSIHTRWTIEHLLKDIEDIDRYLSLDFSQPNVIFEPIRRENEYLGDRGLMMPTIEDPICMAASLFNMQDFLVYSITETEKMQFFLDALFEIIMERLRIILQNNVKDFVFRVVGPEYATPPYLPKELYFNFVTRYLKEITAMIKKAGAIPRVHSHGKVRYALEQIATTDAMAVDPLEPIPDGDIDLAEIKKLYGDRFVLMGNIELKDLENSTPYHVEELVKKAMDDAKEGGGFILLPTATPINVPLSKRCEENFLAFIEAGLKYGKY